MIINNLLSVPKFLRLTKNEISSSTTGISQDMFGTKAWLIDGKYHRTDGPAIEFFDGSEHYYLNGIYYFENEYVEAIKIRY